MTTHTQSPQTRSVSQWTGRASWNLPGICSQNQQKVIIVILTEALLTSVPDTPVSSVDCLEEFVDALRGAGRRRRPTGESQEVRVGFQHRASPIPGFGLWPVTYSCTGLSLFVGEVANNSRMSMSVSNRMLSSCSASICRARTGRKVKWDDQNLSLKIYLYLK